MPADALKSGWQLESNAPQDQQMQNYYNSTVSYNQHYNLYNSSYYRFPYLPTNSGTIYAPTYTNTIEYNGYPASGVQYYNKSIGGVGSSSISTFQQYTNSLVNAGQLNTADNPQITGPKSTSPTLSYYEPVTPKTATKPKKSKRKKPITVSGKPETVYKRVYVWELDEIYSEEFSSRPFATRPESGVYFESELRRLIGQILSTCFQLNSAEDFYHTNIEDANIEESLAESTTNNVYTSSKKVFNDVAVENRLGDEKSRTTTGDPQAIPAQQQCAAINPGALENIKRMATFQQQIKHVYMQHRIDLISLIKNFGLEAEIPYLYPHLQILRQLDSKRAYSRCMRLICEKSVQEQQQANVVMCQESLPVALAKLLVQGGAAVVQAENVYSAARNDMSNALERIVARFKREKLFIITSKPETIQLARNFNIPVWRVTHADDVEKLHLALQRWLC